MGTIKVTIQVGDFHGERFEPVEVLVSTRATFTTVPGSLLRQLDVPARREVQAQGADGSLTTAQVGETMIRLEGKSFITPVVFGEEHEAPVIGIVALGTALLAVDPVTGKLVPTHARRRSSPPLQLV